MRPGVRADRHGGCNLAHREDAELKAPARMSEGGKGVETFHTLPGRHLRKVS